jgi:pyrroloquinoline-quinone synthase
MRAVSDSIALDPRTFADSLRELIEARRSFGGHPLWHRIAQGGVDRAGLQCFAVEFFLQVREFPRAVSGLHTRCSDLHQRIELAESLYEEETGRISGCNRPHPELFLLFGTATGLPREAFERAAPLPSTASLIHWFELSTRSLPYLEGAAAITLAAEGQVPGAFGPFARALEKQYGMSREQVAFWDIHEIADRDHSGVGDHAVVRHAVSAEAQRGVRAAVETSLAQWWQFFDGIERAIDAGGAQRAEGERRPAGSLRRS